MWTTPRPRLLYVRRVRPPLSQSFWPVRTP
jgi:hypothetical protein